MTEGFEGFILSKLKRILNGLEAHGTKIDTAKDDIQNSIADVSTNITDVKTNVSSVQNDVSNINDNVLSLMSGGNQLVKSIQYKDFIVKATGDSKTATINPVDPNKCIIILERQSDPTRWETKVIYTLGTESVTVISGNGSNVVNLSVRIHIIEFY